MQEVIVRFADERPGFKPYQPHIFSLGSGIEGTDQDLSRLTPIKKGLEELVLIQFGINVDIEQHIVKIIQPEVEENLLIIGEWEPAIVHVPEMLYQNANVNMKKIVGETMVLYRANALVFMIPQTQYFNATKVYIYNISTNGETGLGVNIPFVKFYTESTSVKGKEDDE